MQKNPNVKLPELEESQKSQGKHKRKETVCSDKRRDYNHCGICGSPDLIYTQLVYCKLCGKENYDIAAEKKFATLIAKSPCDCKGESYIFRNKKYHKNPRMDITLRVCSACGSVESNTCPACKQANKKAWTIAHGFWLKCWTSPFGEKYCRACGYRHPGYKGGGSESKSKS